MEKRKIKDLKRGDYFTLTPVKEPNISQVWVRGEYIPQAKCYSTYKWENINHEVIRRRGQRSIRSSWYTIPGRPLILICKYKLNCLYL